MKLFINQIITKLETKRGSDQRVKFIESDLVSNSHIFEPMETARVLNSEAHQFHFRTRLLGSMVVMEAFELEDGHPCGYEFQVIGEPDDDLFMLLKQVIERIRRALSVKHIKQDEHGPHIANMHVRGRIEWDENEDGRVPIVIVDGRELTWERFGQMMAEFEGWQFKMEILDRSDEI